MKSSSKLLLALTIAGAFSLGASVSAYAQQVRVFTLQKAPTPIEFAKTLMGNSFVPKLKMRGVRQLGEAADGNVPIIAAGPFTPDASNALAVPIPFGFDSATLASDAREPLDQIAEGIKLVHAQSHPDAVMVIEGHTDAIGQSAYNKRLSQRRAAAVKRYLVSVHGLSPELLKAVGKGQSEPLNPTNPRGEENRRVQFRLG
jgi:outer membrane protein OmpA-like peptidoglycan-associated protein